MLYGEKYSFWDPHAESWVPFEDHLIESKVDRIKVPSDIVKGAELTLAWVKFPDGVSRYVLLKINKPKVDHSLTVKVNG